LKNICKNFLKSSSVASRLAPYNEAETAIEAKNAIMLNLLNFKPSGLMIKLNKNNVDR
jgi:hypothetical protein